MSIDPNDIIFMYNYAARLRVSGPSTGDNERMAALLPTVADELRDNEKVIEELRTEIKLRDQATGWNAAHGRSGW